MQVFSRPSGTSRIGPPALLVLLACLIVALAQIGFRSYALRAYSALPADFDGPSIFRARYLLDHGSFLLEPLTVYSYWSGGVNTQMAFYLMEAIQAAVIALSRLTMLSPRLIHQIVLTLALMGLTTFLLLRSKARNPQRLADVVLVSMLITLGTPVMIMYLNGWNSAYGWVVLLALTAAATSNLRPPLRIALIMAIFFCGPPLYHTFAVLLTVFLVSLWACGKRATLRWLAITPTLALTYYLIYQLYVSVQFFHEIAAGLRDVLSFDFLHRDPLRVTIAVSGAAEQYLRYLHLLLWGLLCIPIMLVLLRFVRELRRPSAQRVDALELRYMAVVTALSGAVTVIALLFGVKFSFEFMIGRGAEYIAIPAVLAVITELRYSSRRSYIYPLGIVVLALSMYSFWVQAPTVRASNLISEDEAEGYAWLAARLQADDVVFTDFRLSAPFIADGHFRVLGVTGQGSEPTAQLLDAIYYQSSPATLTKAINHLRTYHDKIPPDYLFLSTQMLRDYPGLNGYGTHFKPAPLGFFAAVATSADWDLVYQNAQVRVYKRHSS